MDSNQPPDITSFVIRFVHPPASERMNLVKYHGSIRHIQTNRELNFTQWEEAVSFIRSFVPLEDQQGPLIR